MDDDRRKHYSERHRVARNGSSRPKARCPFLLYYISISTVHTPLPMFPTTSLSAYCRRSFGPYVGPNLLLLLTRHRHPKVCVFFFSLGFHLVFSTDRSRRSTPQTRRSPSFDLLADQDMDRHEGTFREEPTARLREEMEDEGAMIGLGCRPEIFSSNWSGFGNACLAARPDDRWSNRS